MQDRVSDTDRYRFQSLIFDHDQSPLVDDTFNNSLHILEIFYDQGIMSENDLNTVIKLLYKKNCPIAAKRLENHIQRSVPKQISPTQYPTNVACEDEKTELTNKHVLLSCKNNVYQSSLNEQGKHMKKSFCQLNLIKCILLFLITVISVVSTFIIIYMIFLKPSNKMAIEKILVIERGKPFGGPGGDGPFDDGDKAMLTYNDKITDVTALEILDDNGESILLSLTFSYTNGKSGHVFGGLNPPKPVQNRYPLHLSAGEHITEVVMYRDDRNIINAFRPGKLTHIIVGISFKTNHGEERLFGSANGTENKESFENYFLGYVQGKSGGYIDSLRFTWYKNCLNNSTVFDPTYGYSLASS